MFDFKFSALYHLQDLSLPPSLSIINIMSSHHQNSNHRGQPFQQDSTSQFGVSTTSTHSQSLHSSSHSFCFWFDSLVHSRVISSTSSLLPSKSSLISLVQSQHHLPLNHSHHHHPSRNLPLHIIHRYLSILPLPLPMIHLIKLSPSSLLKRVTLHSPRLKLVG